MKNKNKPGKKSANEIKKHFGVSVDKLMKNQTKKD